MIAPIIGLTSWRLPGSIAMAPSLASSAGASALQVDYGGPSRDHELRVGSDVLVQLRRSAVRESLPITAVALNALNDIGVPSTDPDTERERDRLCAEGMAAAVELGARTILVPAFRRSAMTSDRDRARTAVFLRQTAVRARESGLTVAHENVMHPSHVRDLLDAVPAANLTIMFDTGNLAEHGVDARAYLAATARRLHSEAHIKGFTTPPAGREPLGRRGTPLQDTIHELIATGRVGTYVIETDHRRSDMPAIEADVDWLRAALVQKPKGIS